MRGITKALAAIALLAASAWAQAAAPDTEAVEFYNTTLGHYFVTTSASEALGIDAGAAGPGWVRTGRSFQAWTTKSAAPADAQAVCRFYSTGANSHFYTASADECLQLRGMEAAERAETGGVRGWSYEGVAFFIEVPQAGQCSTGTTKLERLYNNGFANGDGANHRFVDDADLQAMMVDQQWVAEGAAFCAVSKSTGTDADMPPTTTSFDSIAGTWTGSTAWKAEAGGTETRTTHDLSLTLAADGTLTGTGNGCAITGTLTRGDGFRAFFRGSATATGCTDAAFNGDYPRVRLQRLGPAALMVRFQREDDADDTTAAATETEVSIQGILSNGSTTTPPPTPTLTGDWTGTVAWLAVQHMTAGHIFERVSANQALSLSISSTGAVTGSGFGCTVTGTLTASSKKGGDGNQQEGPDDNGHGGSPGSGSGGNPGTSGGAAGFGGSITLAGCDQALFDGTFDAARARLAGASRLVIDFERDASDATSTTHVEIEGTLQAAPPSSP